MLLTGLIGFIALTISLLPAVGSIVMPGSPWELYWDVDDTRPPYDEEADCEIDSYASISAMLTSLVLARFGLWMADISVTQITQESVLEEHRGTIGGRTYQIRQMLHNILRRIYAMTTGVQSGLNYTMDLIKFALVIGLPDDDTFGYLIIASFSSIALGAVSYSSYIFNPKKVAAAAAINGGNKEEDAGEAEDRDSNDGQRY